MIDPLVTAEPGSIGSKTFQMAASTTSSNVNNTFAGTNRLAVPNRPSALIDMNVPIENDVHTMPFINGNQMILNRPDSWAELPFHVFP